MQEQKSVRNDKAQEFEMGRELTEEELATICGGVGNGPSVPDTSMGNLGSLGNLGNLSQLGNELTGQLGGQLGGLLGASPSTGSNQNNAAANGIPTLSSLPGMSSLQNILGGLGL